MSSFGMKMLALLTMLCDHFGYALFSQITILRVIGRMAMPLFAFLLGEGFLHTSDKKKYLFRMVLFALLSEAPFDLLFYGTLVSLQGQNVFFTLSLGLIALWSYEFFAIQQRRVEPGLLAVGACALASELLRADYGMVGVLMVFLLYVCREKWHRTGLLALSVALQMLRVGVVYGRDWGMLQGFALLAALPIFLYNGTQGRRRWKWFFYLFYPIHLLLLYFLRMAL